MRLTLVFVLVLPTLSAAQESPARDQKPVPAGKAVLEIELPPGAKATIDGEDVGTGRRWTYGPFQPGQRLACQVRVQFRAGGEARRTVYLQAGWRVGVHLPEPDDSGIEMVLQAGHTEEVFGVAFSPDGRYVATAGGDKTGILWDAHTGQRLQTYQGHNRQVESVVFSADGKQLLTASMDETAILWDVATGRELRSLVGHTHYPRLAQFDADGGRILTVSAKEAILWDARTGKRMHTIAGTDLRHGAWSPDGGRIVLASTPDTVAVWDARTGQQLRTFRVPVTPHTRLAFSPKGDKLLLSSADDSAVLWDLASNRPAQTLRGHTGKVGPVALSPDGTRALTGSEDRTAALWDTQTGKKLRAFPHAEVLYAAVFSPNGKQVLTGTHDGRATLWDADSGAKVRVFQGAVAASRGSRPGVTPKTGWSERTPPGGVVWGLAFRPGRRHQAVLACGDGAAVLWDLAEGRPVRVFEGQAGSVNAVVFSPDGNQVLTNSSDGTAALWDVATGQKLRTFTRPPGKEIARVAFHPDGKRIGAGSDDGTAVLYDAATGRVLHTLQGHTDEIVAVAFSPDGRHIYTGSYDKTVLRWDADTGRQLGALVRHTGTIRSLAVTPDGRHVVTGSTDRLVILWDARTGREVRRLKEDADYSVATSLAFSADGRLACSGWCGNPSTWWDLQTGQKLRTVHGHSSCVMSVALSDDGRLLLTGSRDGTARLWDLASGDELARLVSVDGGRDWLVVTARGLFDGSAGGREKVSYRVGGGLNVVPVDRFFQDFYRPGLLAALWKGERPTPDAKLGAQRPPTVRILSPAQGGPVETEQVTLEVEVLDEGGGVQGPYLFHNGARVVTPGKVERAGKIVKRSFPVILVQGDNRLEVKAASADGSWESEPARLLLRFEKALDKSALHLLAVGVNRYAQEALNLQFAAADAKALAELFRRRGKALYREANVTLLQDAQATKVGILQALDGIARRAKPADTLVVFLAGHGTMVGQRYFFIPHDFQRTEGKTQEEDVRQQALAVDVLGDAVGAVPALKRLLIFDTCQSGGAVVSRRTGRDPFAFRGEVERLSRAQGMFTLAAAAAGEEAQEVPELGHGVLSYALLAGLRAVQGGPLERQSVRPSGSDKVADVLEWFSFASAHVPRLTQKYFGREQDVQMSSQGSSFPLLPVEDR